MADLNSLIEEAQRQAGEQFEAAWKLHVNRVSETLESGWRENIARVVEQRFARLKDELGEANESHLAGRLEEEVTRRLDGEWHSRLEAHARAHFDEEFERRVREQVDSGVAERLEHEVSQRLESELGNRLEAEVALRLAHVLPDQIENGVQERLGQILPERVQESVALRLAEEIPIHVASQLESQVAVQVAVQVAEQRASWDAEFLPLVEQTREEVRNETAIKTRDTARRELGLQFSQSLRVLRHAKDGNEWKHAFLDSIFPFCALSALFLVTKDRFSLEGVRGMAGDLETGFALEFEEAAAFYNSLQSREVVIAMRTDSEVSPYVMSLRPEAISGNCCIFPVLIEETAVAMLYVEPGEQPLEVGAVEALVNAAGLALQGIRALRAIQASSLVNIATALNPNGASGDAFVPELVAAGQYAGPQDGSTQTATPVVPDRSFSWDELSQEQRELHMRAQRFARVQVAEMRLYKDDAVKAGRRDSNIYLRLKAEMDEARERYLAQFLDGQTHMRDYLHGELVETLAIDNPQLMGPDYPGPLV